MSKKVDIIASGYEWQCPNCFRFNKEIEYKELVKCKTCKKTFEANLPEHAYK
jgi:protein-arginine kinase activator protein McsA